MSTYQSAPTRRGFLKAAAGVALAAAGTAAVCYEAPGGDESDANVFRIGGIGPLTGAAAIYGTATKYGAQIAVKEVNDAGKIAMKLNWQDDEHDPEKAVNAYNNLKDWGMTILVGSTTTAPCVAVSAETNTDNIFELTPSASSTDVIGGQKDEDGNITIPRKSNVFQMCFTDPNQGTASAQYIKERNLGSRVAVIYNNSDAYSTGIYKKFAAEAESDGLEIVSTTTFTDDSATDFSVQLNKAKGAEADLVFLPIYYQPAALIFAQAKTMGYEPKFFGVDGMDGILTLEGFDVSLAENVMLLTPFTADEDNERTQNFVATYKKAHGEVPNQFAADAYDCVHAIAQAIEVTGITPEDDPSEICDRLVEAFSSGTFAFDGLTGSGVTWSDTGEVAKSPKGMIIKNGAYVSM